MNDLISTFSIWSPGAFVMTLLVFGSGFFSGSETALFYLSREELRRLQSGSTAARQAARLMRDPDRLLTVVLFWNLVINLTYFAVSLVTAKRLVDAGHTGIAGGMSLVSLVGMILFGEVLPKSLAVIFRRTIAIWASWPLALAIRILNPILPILGATTRALQRALFPHLKVEPYLEIEDIERAIDSSEVGVELIHLEQKILGRILELAEMRSEELMRPRGTYPVFRSPVTVQNLAVFDEDFPYLILADGESETLTGAIPLAELSRRPDGDLEKLAEKLDYVPWCGKVSEVLSILRTNIHSVAAVVNEYGECIGIITEDDIVDTLLNPESSRGRRILDRDPVHALDHGRYLADGLTTLRYLAQRIGVDFEVRDDGLLTIAGLMHDRLERFPEVGDECLWEGYLLRVTFAGEPGDALQVEVMPAKTSASEDRTEPDERG